MNRTSLIGCTAALRVASNRQRRRILNHPTRWRALERESQPEPVNIEELKYKPTFVPETKSYNGWSAAPESPLPDLPFHVKRTTKGLQIPVYRDIRGGGTKVMTLIRRHHGDTQELANEMSKVCGGEEAVIRPGRIEVAGDHVQSVRKWLVGLGF